mgnify:CR=1 FL=1
MNALSLSLKHHPPSDCKNASKPPMKGFAKAVGILDIFLAKTICQYVDSFEDVAAFSKVFYPRKTKKTICDILFLVGKIHYLKRTSPVSNKLISHSVVLPILQKLASRLSPEETSCFYPIESWLFSIAKTPDFLNAKTLRELFQKLLLQETSQEYGEEKVSDKLLAIFQNTRDMRISSPWGEKSRYLQQLYDYKNMENTYTAADEKLQDLDLSNREEYDSLPALLTAMNTVKTVAVIYINRLSEFSSIPAKRWLFLKARAEFWMQEMPNHP